MVLTEDHSHGCCIRVIAVLEYLNLALSISHGIIIIIIITTRPGANTTKYNHQQDNLLMGHVQTVHGQLNTVCAGRKMYSNTILEELTGT